jgi:hypothetical protein
MPGKKISDHQVLQYKKQRKTKGQSAAAATVGISDRSAQRIDAALSPSGDAGEAPSLNVRFRAIHCPLSVERLLTS